MQMNLYAFLCMLRHAEGTGNLNGYRIMFGGGTFDSFADHPRVKVRRRSGRKYITSTAAGAYQFLERTWDECAAVLDLPDFSPESQDRAARYLIYRRKAMPDVLAGRLYSALMKCNREWASLPGSPYGQPTISASKAHELFTEFGGVNIEKR